MRIKYWSDERGSSKKKECVLCLDSLVLPVICRRKMVNNESVLKQKIQMQINVSRPQENDSIESPSNM